MPVEVQEVRGQDENAPEEVVALRRLLDEYEANARKRLRVLRDSGKSGHLKRAAELDGPPTRPIGPVR